MLGTSDVEIESVGTNNVEAYDLYLQALSHQVTGSYGSLHEAEGLLKDALLVDAQFLDAKIALARVYMQQADTGMRDFAAARVDGIVLLEQVLTARPDDVLAQGRLLLFTTYSAWNTGTVTAVEDALPQMQALVAAAPNNVDLRRAHSYLLFDAGRLEESLSEAQTALAYDPLNAGVYFDMGWVHREMENLELAQAAIERSLELNPDQPNAYSEFVRIKAAMGDGASGSSRWR